MLNETFSVIFKHRVLVKFFLDLKSVEIVLIWSVVPCIVISYALDESPRWLLSKGQEIPAKKIIKTMIKMNGQPLENLSKVQKPQEKTVQKGTLGDILKRRGMCRNQLLLCVYWLGTSMGAYGLIFYTPTFDWNVYLVFVLPSLINIPMIFMVPFLENK